MKSSTLLAIEWALFVTVTAVLSLKLYYNFLLRRVQVTSVKHIHIFRVSDLGVLFAYIVNLALVIQNTWLSTLGTGSDNAEKQIFGQHLLTITAIWTLKSYFLLSARHKIRPHIIIYAAWFLLAVTYIVGVLVTIIPCVPWVSHSECTAFSILTIEIGTDLLTDVLLIALLVWFLRRKAAIVAVFLLAIIVLAAIRLHMQLEMSSEVSTYVQDYINGPGLSAYLECVVMTVAVTVIGPSIEEEEENATSPKEVTLNATDDFA